MMNKDDLQSLKATNELLKAKSSEQRYEKKSKVVMAVDDGVEQADASLNGLETGLDSIDVMEDLRNEMNIFSKTNRGKRYRKQVIFRQFAKGIKPDPLLTVSQWADRYRMLSTKASAFPGPWQTKRTPYLKEIMDCLSASAKYQQVVIMKGAQLGVSEAGNNFLGYVIHHVPGPMLYVMPTVETVKRVSKQRIATMIEDTPVIRERVSEPRAKDSGNTILAKEFPGGTLVLTGANSAVGLRSMPARYLFLDEVDGYPYDLDQEGDPINLAIKRTQTFSSKRKIFMVSTPTMKGVSRIEKAFEDSDQRYYHVPCPHCDEYQTITWDKIRWLDNQPDSAYMICQHCHAAIDETDKNRMLQKGEWQASHPESNIAGFHLSGLYSPTEWYPWSQAVADYLTAKDDPALLKTWVNTTLGETYEEPGTQIDSNLIYYRREKYAAEIPKDGIVLTAGVDVQGDRLEAEAVAWNEHKESWSIDYRIFWGDPDQPEVWNNLDEWLRKEWKHETGHYLKIQVACIDSGGHHTQQVYQFCKFRPRYALAIKGAAGMGRPIISAPSNKRTGTERRPVPLYTVGVDTAKELLYARLLKTEPGPGYCHFPNQEPPYNEVYFQQLTAEKMVTKTAHGIPRPVWELPSGKRNEALDCRVYAMAAIELLRPDFEKWKAYLVTQPITDEQREYQENRKRIEQKFNPKKRVVRSAWMGDVLGGPGSLDH